MLQRLATALTRWSTRYVPDSWIIAVILTFITFLLAFFAAPGAPTPAKAYTLIQHWGNGFWVLLEFAMQMSLIIVTGYVLSTSPPVRRLLNWLAGLPRNPREAVALTAFVSMVLAWINWGLSLIASAVLVRAVARRQRGVDYGLLVCCAYLGLGGMWHSGLSGSAPLLVATPRHFMEQQMGIVPVTSTIFTPFNLGLAAVVLVVWTGLAALLHPRPEDTVEVDPALLAEPAVEEAGRKPAATFAERVYYSPVVNLAVATIAVIWLIYNFGNRGFGGINLNSVNFLFLTLGILLHWTPASFLRAAAEGSGHIWGVVIQFPFYAGMFGIIRDSGLAKVIADWFTAIATPATYPVIIYWYSGILNYFVPSGGSKWAIEAPYVVEAAKNVGVSMPAAVISYAWGDMATDVIQPFWAIPLLGVTKVEFRHIVGYGLVFFAVFAIITTVAFLLAPLFLG
jgi:short-chain fatty acids transporter